MMAYTSVQSTVKHETEGSQWVQYLPRLQSEALLPTHHQEQQT